MPLEPVEQAIIELVVRKNVIDGKKVFQKLCYFIQEGEHVPLGLSFRMQRYGPFSDELNQIEEDLASRMLIYVEDLGESGFRISAGDSASTDTRSVATHAITEVLSKVGGEGGLTLELMASIHFLSKSRNYSGDATDADRLVDGIQAWKGRKFDEAFIRRNIERLEELNYLPAR